MDIKDLDMMTGLEFEKFCFLVLKKSGFMVQHTKQSSDGGIDLIAYNTQMFYKGKYIIQCKRYSHTVGEPVLRDLYGTVMSENANKGILMTTNYFSKQAIEFSHNKPLELINRMDLEKLVLSNYNLKKLAPSYIYDPKFYKIKYDFLNENIMKNFNDKGAYYELLNFLEEYYLPNKNKCNSIFNLNVFSYFDSYSNNPVKFEIISNGLNEDFILLYKKIISQFYSSKKEIMQIYKRHLDMKYNGYFHLYSNNLLDYVMDRRCFTGILSFSDVDSEFYSLYSWKEKVGYNEKNNYPEILNLLSIFRFFGINQGYDILLDKIYSCTCINFKYDKYLNHIIRFGDKQLILSFSDVQFIYIYYGGNKKPESVVSYYCNFEELTKYFINWKSDTTVQYSIQKINNLIKDGLYFLNN